MPNTRQLKIHEGKTCSKLVPQKLTNKKIENSLLNTKYISLKIYCLNVASLYACNNTIAFSTACLCLYSPFCSTCFPPHYSSLQLLPSQVLLFPGTTKFSVVALLPVLPSILSLLSRRTSHSFTFPLSSFPQCRSQVWGHVFCRCSAALGDHLTVHVQKREVLGL